MMKRINRHNYEAYFLDYIEGNLEHDHINELKQFLLLNPDLKQELDQYTNSVKLENISFKFKNKNKLRVPDFNFTNPVNIDNIDNYLIAKNEKDLNNEQLKELEIFLDKNPHLQKTTEIYKKTYLEADKHIKFRYKQKLYVNNNNKLISNKLLYIISSVAAAIILLILFFPFQNNQITDQLTQTNTEKKIKMNQPYKKKEVQNKSFNNIIDIQETPPIKTNYIANNITENPDIQNRENINLKKINIIETEKININLKSYVLASNTIKNEDTPLDKNLILEKDKKPKKITIRNPIDYNKDKKINYWELIKATSSVINKITTDDLISFKFTDEGKFTEFTLKNDVIKITKN